MEEEEKPHAYVIFDFNQNSKRINDLTPEELQNKIEKLRFLRFDVKKRKPKRTDELKTALAYCDDTAMVERLLAADELRTKREKKKEERKKKKKEKKEKEIANHR